VFRCDVTTGTLEPLESRAQPFDPS
jgi:hypothetical protein